MSKAIEPHPERLTRYRPGMNDWALAAAESVGKTTIPEWRKRLSLPANAKACPASSATEEDRLAAYSRGLNDVQIAAETGMTQSHVRYWRKANDLPTNFKQKTPDPVKGARRLALYEAGISDREMSRREGVRLSVIQEWRGKRGLPALRLGRAALNADERARRMLFYSLGWTDGRIAKEERVQETSIKRWRDAAGLGRNASRKGTDIATVLARIKRAVGRALPPDIADDAVGNLMLAVMDGSLCIEQIEQSARKFGNRVLDQFASKFGPRSLDEELGDDDGFRMIDLIPDHHSTSWLEKMGATVW